MLKVMSLQVNTGGALSVKSASEISKKILSTASTLTLAEFVDISGTTTVSEPSLGVEAATTTGKVRPPSSESKMFTLAQLIGARSELATSQVTV